MSGSERADVLRRAPLADRHPQGFSPSRRFAQWNQVRVLHLYQTGFASFRFGRPPLLPVRWQVLACALQPLDWVAPRVVCLRGVAWTPPAGLPRCLPEKAMVGLRSRRRNADSDVPDACFTPRRSFSAPRPLPVNRRVPKNPGVTWCASLHDVCHTMPLRHPDRRRNALENTSRVRLRGHFREAVRAPDATLPQRVGRSLLPWVSVPAAKRA